MLPNFSSSSVWVLTYRVVDDTGGTSPGEHYLRNVANLTEAQSAADSVIDKLEALTQGTVEQARICLEITDDTPPDSEASASELLTLYFDLSDGSTSKTSVSMPKSETLSGTLINSGGSVNQTNAELLAWRDEFINPGGYLYLNEAIPTLYVMAVYQAKTR